MSQIKKIVIVGLGGTSAMAARWAKMFDSSLDITVLKEEDLLVRCALPYIVTGNVSLESSIKSGIFSGFGIKEVKSKATHIDRENKTVTDTNGNIYPYDVLVLATGSTATVPPILGRDLKGVFVVHTAQDGIEIKKWVDGKMVKKAVVVGAGFIGMEIGYTLASEKGAKVTVVEMLDHVLPLVIDPDMSEEVEKYLVEKGIELKLSQRVANIMGREGEVTGIELASGEKIEANMVILGVGIRANWELAEAAGLDKGKIGVKVNKYLQTSDPNIYAGGDLIEYESFITGKPIAGQLRPNAIIAGKVIAKNILGYKIEYPKFLNNFATKMFDMSVAATGITESAAKEEGIDVLTAKSESGSKHGMMKGRKPYTVKLLFDKKTKKLIGGQIISLCESAVKEIDVINLAIRCGLTPLDLTTLGFSAQPELSADVSEEPTNLAAEQAFRELYPLPFVYK
jgi:NADH oxidase (H2O2-forming)